MYELIVLGLIPGTNLQITFELFMTAVLLMVCGLLAVWYVRRFHPLGRGNQKLIKLGHLAHKLLINGQNALPPKLQLFK